MKAEEQGGATDPKNALTGRRQCTATSKATGQQCQRAPIKGGTVCSKHGGGAPQVKRSAKERLLELREPALAALAKVLHGKADDATKVRAALGILDRTGFAAGVKLEMDVTLKPWQQAIRSMMGDDRQLEDAGISRDQLAQADRDELVAHIQRLQRELEQASSRPTAIEGTVTRIVDVPSTSDRPVRTPRKTAPPLPAVAEPQRHRADPNAAKLHGVRRRGVGWNSPELPASPLPGALYNPKPGGR